MNVTVTGITGAVADPATFEKDAPLADETITIKDASGNTLTTATLTSVSVDGSDLTENTDYTYTAGVITFKTGISATASGDIAIVVSQ